MNTKRIVLFIVVVFCFGILAQAQRGVRIGYIDMDYILESVPEYREASMQLESRVQRWKQDIEKKQNEVDQMKLNLANEKVLLTPELIEERTEEIKVKEDELLEYQQNRFGPNGDLIIQRRQLVQPIQDQVFNIIQEIAEARKYDFIFDKSADVVMLFAAERNDISDIVLRSLERAGRRVQAMSRKEQREIEKQEKLAEKQNEPLSEREAEIQRRKEERKKEMEERTAQREKEIEQRKNEREEMMKQRQRERDSIRDARRREAEERRQQIIEDRERRRDSIIEARKQRNN